LCFSFSISYSLTYNTVRCWLETGEAQLAVDYRRGASSCIIMVYGIQYANDDALKLNVAQLISLVEPCLVTKQNISAKALKLHNFIQRLRSIINLICSSRSDLILVFSYLVLIEVVVIGSGEGWSSRVPGGCD